MNLITQIYEDPRNNLYLSQNLTEVQVISRHFSNDGAFECNILNPLCNGEANPRRIIHHPQLISPEYAPKELMEEALEVKFALDLIVRISRIHNAVYVSESRTLLFPTILAVCRSCSKSFRKMKVN